MLGLGSQLGRGHAGVWKFLLHTGRICGLGSLCVKRRRGVGWAGGMEKDPGDQKALLAWGGVRRTLESL